MRSPTRRRVLALASLTLATVVTGSIAVADGSDAGDIAAEALAASDSVVVDDADATDLEVDDIEIVRAARTPAVPARSSGIASEPSIAMVTSYYGPGLHGNLTANGEVFDQWAMTAAHKSLPFGTELRVTNPSNGRSVMVRINDRGPFTPGRDLDLSAGAADEIGLGGVRRLEVTVL